MTDPRRKKTRLLVVGAELAITAALLGVWWLGPAAPPSLSWRVGDGGAPEALFAEVPHETPLELEIELPEPMHVYVCSHDTQRGGIAMFPSGALRSDVPSNPLPAGRHRLPGQARDLRLLWHAGDGVGPTSFLVVASVEPLPDLVRVLGTMRQMGNAAFPGRPVLGTYAPEGGMEVVPPFGRVPTDVLRACAGLLDPEPDGPMRPWTGHDGVFLKALRLSTRSAAPLTDEEIRADLARRFGELEGALSGPGDPPAGAGR
jgi:hypothetical protein